MKHFWSDREGNVALIFAVAAVPLLGTMGAAVDYSMASAQRTDLQKALDATALALTKIMPAEQAVLNQVGEQYFLANLGEHSLANLQFAVVPEVGTLRVSASGTYKAHMANLIGFSSFQVGASTEAKWSIGKVELALVLDGSLSMNELGKIQALRASTVNLLNVLENAAREPGDAKVGIVAFDGMVNVGYTQKNAPSWIRWDWWDANAYDSISNRCSINFNVSSVPAGKWLKQHCEEQFTTSSSCQGASGSSQTQCQNRGGKWVTTKTHGVWTPLNKSQWAGCVFDRNQPDDASDTAPTGSDTYYPAAKCYDTPPQAITPLSEDWNLLRSRANALTPTGWTNITIGLAWGWHVLSPTATPPFANGGAPYDTENLNKYIILMTDGYNTMHRLNYPTNCPLQGPCQIMDLRTAAACQAIKDQGIKIYAIRLVQGNADLLRACASSEDMYYDVESAGQLSGVFSSIGSEIASLHLSK